MGYKNRIDSAFINAPKLLIHPTSRYVLFSDCHRGIGNTNDNFLKNKHLFKAALSHYYNSDFTYIELGDGDELWENQDFNQILEIHKDIFEFFKLFSNQKRFYMLYGNHDMIKKRNSFTLKFPIYEGIILEDFHSRKLLYLTHGHQTNIFNSTFWSFSHFLVRFIWKPLEQFGIIAPTSPAKNYSVTKKSENRLEKWAKQYKTTIITGHTHRPVLDPNNTQYCNTGSCVHPHSITCIEIQNSSLLLVKWSLENKQDLSIYVKRTILSGPVNIKDL